MKELVGQTLLEVLDDLEFSDYPDFKGYKEFYSDKTLPVFPLMEIARVLDVSIIQFDGNPLFRGLYNQKKIFLSLPDEYIFLHELSHAVHEHLIGDLGKVPEPISESVAYLCSECLCRIVLKTKYYTKHNLERISHYANEIEEKNDEVIETVFEILNFMLWQPPEQLKLFCEVGRQ
jgi:hypothetical protein